MNLVIILAVTLAPVFADNMVLQRDQPVPIWGTARHGEIVTVEFAGQMKSATADSAGQWRVTLDPMPVSAKPQMLHVSRITLHDILVGEIWVCAGQSNMEWPLAKEAHAREELPAANNSKLRLLNMQFAGQYYFAKPFGPDVLARMTPDKFYSGEWEPCTPESAQVFSAVGYYFGKEVAAELKVPVGLINFAVGGSPAEAWIRRAVLPAELPLDPWCLKRMKENLGENKARHPFQPGFLWEAGIARLIPFAIRGVLWYQGESNAETDWRVKQHEMLFPLLVRDWREQWKQDFPFFYVQLPGMNRPNWPVFRDQQRRFLDTISNTGMAVTLDLGEENDVHPRNKRDVGHRLALLALGKGSSPLPKSLHSGVVTFDQAGLWTREGKPPATFEAAGADGVFRPVAARIEGNQVIIAGPAKAVRYGWKPYCPEANLVNAGGLPAPTFELQATTE